MILQFISYNCEIFLKNYLYKVKFKIFSINITCKPFSIRFNNRCFSPGISSASRKNHSKKNVVTENEKRERQLRRSKDIPEVDGYPCDTLIILSRLASVEDQFETLRFRNFYAFLNPGNCTAVNSQNFIQRNDDKHKSNFCLKEAAYFLWKLGRLQLTSILEMYVRT